MEMVTARKELRILRIASVDGQWNSGPSSSGQTKAGPGVFARHLAARVARSFSCSSTALPRAAWKVIGFRDCLCTFAALRSCFPPCCCTRKAWSAKHVASASIKSSGLAMSSSDQTLRQWRKRCPFWSKHAESHEQRTRCLLFSLWKNSETHSVDHLSSRTQAQDNRNEQNGAIQTSFVDGILGCLWSAAVCTHMVTSCTGVRGRRERAKRSGQELVSATVRRIS